MAFPTEKELKKVRKKLGKSPGFLMLDPEADGLAKFRFKICQELLKYAQKNNLNTVQNGSADLESGLNDDRL